MTKLNFYNGLREIGGTFVEVETDNAKCMFDFGFAVADRMDKNIKSRKELCASDYATLGMLTSADGIYSKETAERINKKAYGEVGKECFFVISHMHIDHMGGLGLLSKDIPVYMSEDSLRLYKRLAANNDIQEGVHEKCIGIPYGESFTIGDITVKVLQIDHDVIGASGFLITTPDSKICYTGDYRFHGFHPEITESFAKAVEGADFMITEGVTVSFADVDMLSLNPPTEEERALERTEYTLQSEIKQLSKETEGLIVINPYNRNVERIHNLNETIKEAGRKLVLEDVQADYTAEFYPDDRLYVYKETMSDKEIEGRNTKNVTYVSRAEILKNPSAYVLQLDYSNMYELIDLKEKTGIYVHMDGAPLGDYDPSFAKMKALLEALNITYEHKGTGGHAKPYYLKHMIDTVSPKTLIPLHSFRPEQVKSDRAGQIILPNYAESILAVKS